MGSGLLGMLVSPCVGTKAAFWSGKGALGTCCHSGALRRDSVAVTSQWLRVVLAVQGVPGWAQNWGTEHPALHQRLPDTPSSVTAPLGRARDWTLPQPQELCLFALWLIINRAEAMSIRAGPDTPIPG